MRLSVLVGVLCGAGLVALALSSAEARKTERSARTARHAAVLPRTSLVLNGLEAAPDWV